MIKAEELVITGMFWYVQRREIKEKKKIRIDSEVHRIHMGGHPHCSALSQRVLLTHLSQHMTDVSWMASSANSQRL